MPTCPTTTRSSVPPKGILKNAPTTSTSGPGTPGSGQHLQWDESNIALTEVQKDSLMKITEPKTPFVRYNAETDEIEGDIPDLDLGKSRTVESPTQVHMSRGATPEACELGSRRTSFSSTGQASARSGSRSSSRSTSFSIPNEGGGKNETYVPGEEEIMDAETRNKHRAFLKARLEHYANEGAAMKTRTRSGVPGEDSDDNDDRVDQDGMSMEEEVPQVNGST